MVKQSNKLTIVLENLAGGGAERNLTNLMNYLVDEGWKIDLVLVKKEGEFLNQLSKKVRVHDLQARSLYFSLVPLIWYLKKNRPPVVLSSLDLMNLITLLAVKISRVKTLSIIRIASVISKQIRTPIKKVIEKILLSLIYPWADQIIIVSKDAADDLSEYTGIPREKIRVIYNPVISPSMLNKSKNIPDHPWFGKSSSPIILAVGRLNPEKNFPRLVRVFKKVRDKVDTRLLILGEGEEREKLSAQIKSLGLESVVDMPG